MTEEARSRHYELYKDGLERVMVATSAFGLGVDIADITEVVLFGLPTKGSELVQLAGRGGRDPSLSCLVRFVIRDFDIKEHDEGLMKLVSGTSCIRHIILRDILQSDETIEVNDLCCSVCNGCIRPSLFVPEVRFSTSCLCPTCSNPKQESPCCSKGITEEGCHSA